MEDFATHDPSSLRRKYARANALVANVLNKYYNGSARAVDPFVIRRLREEETRLFSIQCFLEEGPAETQRERKESSVPISVSKTSTFSLLDRIFVMCGGYLGGPGSVMRRWEELSDAGYDDAMLEYIALVDKIVPGWDQEPFDYPVTKQENFWKDDATSLQCQDCGTLFSLSIRRHHCRLCLDVFCSDCCSKSLEIALCPGAPLRLQRVCYQCFQEVERNKSLLEVRRVMRENHDLEQQIRRLQSDTEAQLALKQREEAKLRQAAIACGCSMDSLNASIYKRVGSNGIQSWTQSNSSVNSPPAHRFAPRETIEANDQLALANRQLLMGLRVAQCRRKKALEKIDATLAILREAICFKSSNWNVVLRYARVYLTLRELKALARTSKVHRAVAEYSKCEEKCVLEQAVAAHLRPALWQSECLKDEKTQQYVFDLAEEIRDVVDASDSDSDPDDAQANAQALILSSTITPTFSAPLCLSLVKPSAQSATSENTEQGYIEVGTVWKRAYDIILARCRASPSGLEFDAQIHGDVQRTFGSSALRKTKQKRYQKAAEPGTPSKPERAIELRRSALENVLRAFSSVNTEIGYCQGMDHVAALLLSVVDWHEARAFWMLTSLVASPKYALDALYSPGLPHLNLRYYQLERLMKIYLPELARYLGSMDFPISVFATSWFMTLFTNMETLSYDAVLRVFDGFVVAGWKQIFRVALAILQMLQHHILASPFEEIPQIFYDISAHAPRLAVTSEVLARAAKFKVTNNTLKRLESDYAASLSPSSSSSRKRNGVQGNVVVPASLPPSLRTEANGRANAANLEQKLRRSESFKSSLSTSRALANGNRQQSLHRESTILGKSELAPMVSSTENEGEKSPESTRQATLLRSSSIANTRLVV